MASSPSAAKRRKTSPTASLPIADLDNAATPEALFRPRNGLRRTPPPVAITDPARGSQDRASFLSPTKASLARYNPALLSPERRRRGPSGGSDVALRGRPSATGLERRESSSIPPPDPGVDAPAAQISYTPPTPTQAPVPTSPGGSLAIRSRQAPSSSPTATRSAPRTSGIGAAGSFFASSAARRPGARASIQARAEAVEQGDDALPQRRSPRISQPPIIPARPSRTEADFDDDDEDELSQQPDLPPTPRQLGLPDPIMSRPPAGLSNSPSNRLSKSGAAKRKRKFGGSSSAAGSSPLKHALRGAVSPEKAPPNDGPVAITEDERTAARTQREKIRLRDRLRAELRELQVDLQRREDALRRIQAVEARGGVDESLTADELVSILLTPSDLIPQDVPPARPPLASIISSFLPFSFHHSSLSSSSSADPSSNLLDDSPFPTHLPVSVPDPLAYLQVFTPLRLSSTSTLSLPPASSSSSSTPSFSPASSASIRETHTITASSPSALLTTTLTLTVAPLPTPTVLALEMRHLSPWADAELGSWLRGNILVLDSATSGPVLGGRGADGKGRDKTDDDRRRGGKGPVRNDPTTALTATAAYYALAVRRARCLSFFAGKYASLVSASDAAAAVSAAGGRSAGSAGVGAAGSAKKGKKSSKDGDDSRRALRPWLGRQSLLFSLPSSSSSSSSSSSTSASPSPSLLLSWRLEPQLTGNVVSRLEVTPGGWPGAYTEADGRGKLGGISGVFKGVVSRGGYAKGEREGHGKGREGDEDRHENGEEDDGDEDGESRAVREGVRVVLGLVFPDLVKGLDEEGDGR